MKQKALEVYIVDCGLFLLNASRYFSQYKGLHCVCGGGGRQVVSNNSHYLFFPMWEVGEEFCPHNSYGTSCTPILLPFCFLSNQDYSSNLQVDNPSLLHIFCNHLWLMWVCQ